MSPEQAPNPLSGLVPMFMVVLIFYFLVFKPQRDKQKDLKRTIEGLKKNDQVVTIGGLHGVVVLVKEKTVALRVDDNTKLEFDKEAIASVVKNKE